MVRYSLFDTLPFIFLGTLVLFGFSLAFTILSNYGDHSKSEEEGEHTTPPTSEEEGEHTTPPMSEEEGGFTSIQNSFQTLFYACLGNIEGEVSLCLTAAA